MFETPPEEPLGGMIDWLLKLLSGNLVVALCVVGVALLGYGLLQGRISFRRGVNVILGCFVVLAAPAFGPEIRVFGANWRDKPDIFVASPTEVAPRSEVAPSTYNPYANASLRRRGEN